MCEETKLKDGYGDTITISGGERLCVRFTRDLTIDSIMMVFKPKDRASVVAFRDALDEWIEDQDESNREIFWIQSDSRPELNHQVTRKRNAVWACTCEDQTNRGGTCKHITKAIDRRGTR